MQHFLGDYDDDDNIVGHKPLPPIMTTIANETTATMMAATTATAITNEKQRKTKTKILLK